ncbi:hypothetical protein KAU11_01275 [Candidatus Babeliales bacterium]|nr:hypothetical protein [Candidatus Babeliales bacterium]
MNKKSLSLLILIICSNFIYPENTVPPVKNKPNVEAFYTPASSKFYLPSLFLVKSHETLNRINEKVAMLIGTLSLLLAIPKILETLEPSQNKNHKLGRLASPCAMAPLAISISLIIFQLTMKNFFLATIKEGINKICPKFFCKLCNKNRAFYEKNKEHGSLCCKTCKNFICCDCFVDKIWENTKLPIESNKALVWQCPTCQNMDKPNIRGNLKLQQVDTSTTIGKIALKNNQSGYMLTHNQLPTYHLAKLIQNQVVLDCIASGIEDPYAILPHCNQALKILNTKYTKYSVTINLQEMLSRRNAEHKKLLAKMKAETEAFKSELKTKLKKLKPDIELK